jgi:hypothetical protein
MYHRSLALLLVLLPLCQAEVPDFGITDLNLLGFVYFCFLVAFAIGAGVCWMLVQIMYVSILRCMGYNVTDKGDIIDPKDENQELSQPDNDQMRGLLSIAP